MADGAVVPSGSAPATAVAAAARSSSNKDAASVPTPFAHLALFVVLVLPYFVEIQSNVSCLLHACLAVYVGCWRSVKPSAPTEAMTTKVSTLLGSQTACCDLHSSFEVIILYQWMQLLLGAACLGRHLLDLSKKTGH